MKILFRKTFVSQCRKVLYGNPSMLCFRKFLVAKKFKDKREGEVCRLAFEKFLSHSAVKFRTGIFRVSLIWGIEMLYASDGYVTIFRRKIFVSQCR